MKLNKLLEARENAIDVVVIDFTFHPIGWEGDAGFFGFSIENCSKNYSTCKERSLIKWNFHLHPEELLRASIIDILSNETTYCERGNKVDSFFN